MNGIHSISEKKPPKAIAVIQARLLSNRLPGKAIKPLQGYPILGVIILNLLKVKSLEEIYVATAEPGSREIEKVASEFGAKTFIGSAEDVLSRYIEAGKSAQADILLRLTGDNPFVETENSRRTIRLHKQEMPDVCAFTGLPLGCGAESLSLNALIRSYSEIHNIYSEINHSFKEHVSTYMKQNRGSYHILHTPWPFDIEYPSGLRLTIDEEDDYQLAADLAGRLALEKKWPYFELEDILHIVNKNPHLIGLNSHIRQRPWYHAESLSKF